MAKKDKPVKSDVAAVIDIGSNELKLKIAQKQKGKLKYLESLTYDLSLGRDTFDTGKISFEKTDKVCGIINNFKIVAASYGITEVKDIKVVATTAVREATNREYVLDQIKIKTEASVKVIDDMEEKLFIYRLMLHLLEEEYKKSALMVYNGSGNVGISLIEDGKISYAQNVKTGSLRISEIFCEVQEYSNEFYTVVDEYLKGFTDILESEIPSDVKHFIASGKEMAVIAELCHCNQEKLITRIPIESFHKLLNDIQTKTIDRISVDYNLSLDKAELILPALIIYNNLIAITNAVEIISVNVFLSDSLLFQTLFPQDSDWHIKEFSKHTVASANAIAEKYCASEEHCRLVEKFAIKIFDKMKKIHGLGSREKMLLQVAAILHDVGKYVNVRNHNGHSWHIVTGTDIVGLSGLENRIVASLCYYHSEANPSMQDEIYRTFRPSERVLLSKLAAILKISDALDRRHKLPDIEVKIENNELVILADTFKNIDLEIWAFKDKTRFFSEVFGIKAIFKKKRT